LWFDQSQALPTDNQADTPKVSGQAWSAQPGENINVGQQLHLLLLFGLL